jgi:hypothetical protein
MMQGMPAPDAACSPMTESSTTTHCAGSTASLCTTQGHLMVPDWTLRSAECRDSRDGRA